MTLGPRETTERLEIEFLSPFAVRSSESKGRAREEAHDPIRTAFQRDRDRILHSKPFRRLKHKTQVYIAPQGDHFRTRLTHTLEVAQVARTIGRALRLNEDLIEAIALGHDVGHPPFGHAGEAALDAAVKDRHVRLGDGPTGFRHHEQSVRALEGLNLSWEVLAGIGGHSKGESDLSDADGEPTSTLEAAVVRISDRIAYVNHDLDDALRSGIISEVPEAFLRLGSKHGERIGRMVEDLVSQSMGQPKVVLSRPMLEDLNELKDWLFENVYYRYPQWVPEIGKAKELVAELFVRFCEGEPMPEGFEGPQGALDYVAGMTDRFAIREFERLRVPRGFDPDAM